MLSQLREDGSFANGDACIAENKAYHAAVVGLAENEHLSAGFEQLGLLQLHRSTLKNALIALEHMVSVHERLTDALAATDGASALQAILSWGKHSATGARHGRGGADDNPPRGDEFRPGIVVEDLSLAVAREQDGLTGDIDALIQALDARAALEIGTTHLLGNALSIEAERDALVARLRAFMPLVRGATAGHVARYIRADDAFHRIFLSLLRNPCLFEIYNSMDLPELMRRVLVVAPPSVRAVFDDHKGFTNALRSGSADATSAAITEHANGVRTTLAAFSRAAAGEEVREQMVA
jgi:DNA-binding GntR family transcriptional regulator